MRKAREATWEEGKASVDRPVTKLWIIGPREDLPAGDNPWEPWFDKCFGMIVEASTEQAARRIAHDNCVCKDETELHDRGVYMDPKYTDCRELCPVGTERLVMAEFEMA
jgi:hypothetical protein